MSRYLYRYREYNTSKFFEFSQHLQKKIEFPNPSKRWSKDVSVGQTLEDAITLGSPTSPAFAVPLRGESDVSGNKMDRLEFRNWEQHVATSWNIGNTQLSWIYIVCSKTRYSYQIPLHLDHGCFCYTKPLSTCVAKHTWGASLIATASDSWFLPGQQPRCEWRGGSWQQTFPQKVVSLKQSSIVFLNVCVLGFACIFSILFFFILVLFSSFSVLSFQSCCKETITLDAKFGPFVADSVT